MISIIFLNLWCRFPWVLVLLISFRMSRMVLPSHTPKEMFVMLWLDRGMQALSITYVIQAIMSRISFIQFLSMSHRCLNMCIHTLKSPEINAYIHLNGWASTPARSVDPTKLIQSKESVSRQNNKKEKREAKAYDPSSTQKAFAKWLDILWQENNVWCSKTA